MTDLGLNPRVLHRGDLNQVSEEQSHPELPDTAQISQSSVSEIGSRAPVPRQTSQCLGSEAPIRQDTEHALELHNSAGDDAEARFQAEFAQFMYVSDSHLRAMNDTFSFL